MLFVELKMNKGLIKNISYNTLSNLLSIILGLLLNILIARILQPQQMGEYSYVVWFISFLSTLVLLGIPNTLTKYIAQFYPKEKEKIKDIFYSLTKIVIISFFVANFIFLVYLLFSFKNYQLLLYIFLGIVIITLNAIFRSIVIGLEKFNIVALDTVVNLSLQILLVGIILRKISVWQVMLWIYLFCLVISTILFYFFIKKDVKYFISSAKFDKVTTEEKQKIYKYLFYISISLLINMIVWERSEIFFLKIFSIPQDLAFYSIAFTLAYFPNKILTFGNVLLPFMSKIYGEKDFKLTSYYTQITDFVSFLLIPVYLFIFVFSSIIIEVLYGASYIPVGNILKILIIASLVSGISSVATAYVQAIEKTDMIFKIGVFVAIVNILLDFLLIPKYKSLGAAYANSVAQLIGCFLGTAYIIFVHKARFPLFKIIKYVLTSVVLLYIVQILNLKLPLLKLLIYSILFFVIYAALNYKEIYGIINFYKITK